MSSNHSPDKSSDADESILTKTIKSANKAKKRKSNQKRCLNKPNSAEDPSFDFPTYSPNAGSSDSPLSITTCVTSGNDLLKSSVKFLDSSAELERLFGSGSGKHSRSGRKTRTGALLVPANNLRPPLIKVGLDMVRLGDVGSSNVADEFTFTVNKDYKQTHQLFLQALRTFDPNSLTNILAEHPYHISALIQLSDVFANQDDRERSTQLIETALHAYQSNFHPMFNPLIRTYQLNYSRQINRGLFIALFRYALLLSNQGCYRSALEYCKVLLSLNPNQDPLAALLVIDYYCLLSQQYDYLIRLYAELNPTRNLHLLPNFAFSLALAKWLSKTSFTGKLNDHGDSDAAHQEELDVELKAAIIMFPGFVTRLLRHVSLGGVTNLDNCNLFGKQVGNEPVSLGRLLDLYVARSNGLWSLPHVKAWVERNVEALLLQQNDADVKVGMKDASAKCRLVYRQLPRNIQRHLILSGLPEAPPLFDQNAPSPDLLYAYDPLPPNDSIDICPPVESRKPTASLYQGNPVYLFFISFLPSFGGRRVDDEDRLRGANPNHRADPNELLPPPPPDDSTSSIFRRLTVSLINLVDWISRLLFRSRPAVE